MNQFISKLSITSLVIAGAFTFAASDAMAGGVIYKDGDKFVKLGGRIQLQYHYKDPEDPEDPDSGRSSDSVFFRRLRPYIEGSVHKNWLGKFQWDMGKASGDNEIAIKDAFMQYKGIKHLKISVGNLYVPFSREALTSSKKQQLIERTFVGDHNYGTPDRSTGIKVEGDCMGEKLTYAASFTSSSIDPDQSKFDFDSPVNKHSDFNQGYMTAGRIDFHPLGKLKFAQGDFKRKTKATIGIGAFTWNNDGDNNTRFCDGKDRKSCDKSKTDYGIASKKPDVNSVTGIEISGALRIMGLSIDAEYNSFSGDTEDRTVTGGIYKNGGSTLENMAVEGGFMVLPSRLEVVAGYSRQDADNYADPWTRASFGANWFFEKHDIKVQATYRIGKNLKGVKNADENELFFQTQYVF